MPASNSPLASMKELLDKGVREDPLFTNQEAKMAPGIHTPLLPSQAKVGFLSVPRAAFSPGEQTAD